MAEYLYSKLASEKVGEVEGGRETQNLAIRVSRDSKECKEWEMQKGAWRAVSGAAKSTGGKRSGQESGKDAGGDWVATRRTGPAAPSEQGDRRKREEEASPSRQRLWEWLLCHPDGQRSC
ncbi:unnamed protein product [[Candida] boidinii]|nr:unnamed protein product [[Candida] boidinii]